jgi:hypothetical protein
MDAWNALLSSPAPNYPPSYPDRIMSNTPHKRHFPSDLGESFSAAHPPKRRQSGGDITTGNQRVIQPKPSNGQSPPVYPSPQPSHPKKRGRPSKAEVEARNADLVARGKVIPPPKAPTPRTKPPELAPREPESLAQREPVVFPARSSIASITSPGTAEGPVAEPGILFDNKTAQASWVENEASDQSGKKKRRAGSKPAQKDAKPSEDNPSSVTGAPSQIGEFDTKPATQQAVSLTPRLVNRAEPVTTQAPALQMAPPGGSEAKEIGETRSQADM